MKIENGILLNVEDSDIPSDGIFVIPEGITRISDYAFWGCSSLKQVTIPDSVTEIERSAFFECISLESVTLPNSIIKIGYSVFEKCYSLKSITIPNSVTKIASSIFFKCTSLKQVTLPSSVIGIGNYAFYGCTSLESITIPDSVTYIGYSAFSYCKSLTSVNDLPCKCVDDYPMIITSQKQVSENMIYHGYYAEQLKSKEKYNFYVAEKDGFTAHGETAKKAIEDLIYKITRDKLAKEPIYPDTVMTIAHYRAITGACSFGVNKWMEENKIKESDKLTVKQLLPILEKTNAYGFEKFKSLIKDN